MRILDNHYYYDADPDTAATYDMRGRLANTLTRRVDPTFNQLGLMTSFGYGIAEFPAEFAEFRYQHGLMNRGFTPDHENSRRSAYCRVNRLRPFSREVIQPQDLVRIFGKMGTGSCEKTYLGCETFKVGFV